MNTRTKRWLLSYAVTALIFAVLDLVWISFVASNLYQSQIGHLIAPRPNAAGAVAFYLIFVAGMVHYGVRPNDAVHWALLRWAHDRGLRALDWGLSDLDQPGLCHYKRKWATAEGRIRTLNAGGPPVGRRADVDDTLRELTDLLTTPSVPDTVTERAGAVLYRFFC